MTQKRKKVCKASFTSLSYCSVIQDFPSFVPSFVSPQRNTKKLNQKEIMNNYNK